MPLLRWQNKLADEFEVLRPFLRPSGKLAEHYMHPDSGILCKVVYYKEDDIYAVDPEDYETFPLSREDVVLYEFDRRKFRDVLAETLGLRASHESFMETDRVIPLGFWEGSGGESYPVRLIIEWSSQHFAEEIYRMMVRETSPIIVLSLTDRSWTDEVTSLFPDRKSSLAMMKEVVEVDAGVWKATESWRETVLGFLDMVNPPNMVAAPPPFEFRRKGDFWVIRFEGEDMYLKDALGLRCIAQLLAKPNDPVFVSDLKMIVDGQNPENLPAPTSAGEVADPEYLRDVARKHITCEMEYNDAKDRGEIRWRRKSRKR